MNHRTLGKTNLAISELGLGTCFMAQQGQTNVNRCVDFAIDAGVNYFDTAADYGRGTDESMLGAALKGKRDQIVLATKVGYTDDPRDHRNAEGLMKQFEGSLQRLQTDHVDIIQIHEADFRKWWLDYDITDKEGMDHGGELIHDDEYYAFADAPVVQFLKQAKESGKTRFIGLTAKDARRTARMLEHIEVDSLMTAHQFNPILRNAARYLFPITEEKQLGVVLGAALLKGWAAVPQWEWREEPPEWMDDTFHQAYFSYLDIWQQSGLGLAELSMRWLLSEKRLHSIVVGFSGLEVVEDNIRSVCQGELPSELKQAIDDIGIVHPLIYQGRTRL